MEKKQFVALLYVFGIVPMMYAVSTHFLSSLWRVGFGWLNILTLIIFAILFTPNNTPVTNKKKKTSLMILLWVLGIAIIIGGLVRFSDQASLRLYSNVLAPSSSTGEVTETSTGNTLSGSTGDIVAIDLVTGDIDLNTLNSGSEVTQPDYVKPITNSWTTSVDTFQKPDTNPTATQESTITTVLPSKWTLNYAQVIPYLVSKYSLKSNGKSTSFTNVSSTNSLYSAFNIGAGRGMIGADINPASKVSCNTYMVLKGIAAWWKVDYKAGDPFWPYRTAAFNKGEVNWCTAGAFVTKATL